MSWIEVNKPWKFQTNNQERQDLVISLCDKEDAWEENNPFPEGENKDEEVEEGSELYEAREAWRKRLFEYRKSLPENLLLDEIDKNDKKASFVSSPECRAGMLIEVKHTDGLIKRYVIGDDIDKWGSGTERDIENEDVVLRVIDLIDRSKLNDLKNEL